jgi:hypothetical protein
MSAQQTLQAILAVALFVHKVAALNDTTYNGGEFSNNLFSDLAPLLTLFGEQVGALYTSPYLLLLLPSQTRQLTLCKYRFHSSSCRSLSGGLITSFLPWPR